MRTTRFIGMLVAATAMALAACGGTPGSATTPTPTADVGSGQLTGAGSTFVQPLFSRAFYEYTQKYSQVSVNYQAVGSGAGIQQFTKGTVDFGATDVPMAASDIAAAGGDSTLVQIPVTIGAAALAYNLPSVTKLQLDPATVAGIFLGTIKKWNDPAIAALNSGVSLPSTDVTVIHRSDSSGTTYAFTDYLSKVSPDWKTKVGTGKAVQWPTGVGASGTAGVGQQIKTTEGAIGYVELAYVIQSQLQSAYLKNSSGKFLQASVDGANAAAASLTGVTPANFSIVNASAAKAYPIVTYSWVILRTSQTDATKGKALVYLFKWLVTDGQTNGAPLQYGPLPKEAQTYAQNELKTITSGGKAILGS